MVALTVIKVTLYSDLAKLCNASKLMVENNPSIVRGECTEQDSSAESDRYWRLPWIGNFDYRLAGSLLADLKQSSQNQTEIGHFF